MNTIKIGNYIREKRKQNDWSQEQFAELCNVSTKTVSNWENGKSEIKPKHIKTIASILNVSEMDVRFGDDVQNINSETKAVLEETVFARIAEIEKQCFLAIRIAVLSVAVSILTLASVAILTTEPRNNPLALVVFFLIAGFGIFFAFLSTIIIRQKERKSKKSTK